MSYTTYMVVASGGWWVGAGVRACVHEIDADVRAGDFLAGQAARSEYRTPLTAIHPSVGDLSLSLSVLLATAAASVAPYLSICYRYQRISLLSICS